MEKKITPKLEFMRWRIILRAHYSQFENALPSSVLTIAPKLRHENMPDEVSLLLPTNQGPRTLVDAIVEFPQLCDNSALGLFLADPLLNMQRERNRLFQAGIRWIVNLPSVAQQDQDFSRILTDVGLDQGLELKHLAQFRADGFEIGVVVADGAGAAAAAAIDPKFIIVLPRVTDFAAGFPSLHQRGLAAAEVHDAAVEMGWSGLLLCLGEASEENHQSLWPDAIDGLVCRPQLVELAQT